MKLEEQLRLKESLARLGELTAGLAHEFGTACDDSRLQQADRPEGPARELSSIRRGDSRGGRIA